jgi:hypothetical protein
MLWVIVFRVWAGIRFIVNRFIGSKFSERPSRFRGSIQIICIKVRDLTSYKVVKQICNLEMQRNSVFDVDFAIIHLVPVAVGVKLIGSCVKCVHVNDVQVGIEFSKVFFEEPFTAIIIRSDLCEETFCGGDTLWRPSGRETVYSSILLSNLLSYFILAEEDVKCSELRECAVAETSWEGKDDEFGCIIGQYVTASV